MKRLFSLFLAALLLISFRIHAQDSTTTVSRSKTVNFGVMLGYLKTDLSSVNASLKTLGYKPINDNFMTISAGGSFTVKRFLFRYEAMFLLENSVKQTDNVNTIFKGNNFGFGLGYAVIDRPTFRLYPTIGLNAFTTSLTFEDTSPARTMNDLVNVPHYSSKLYFSNASLDIGLQADWLIPMRNRQWDCPQNNKYRLLGLRVGYHYASEPYKGRYNNNQISDAPSYSLKGWYVKIVIGGGYKIRNLAWRK